MTVYFCWHGIAVLARADFHFGGFVTQRLTTTIDKKNRKFDNIYPFVVTYNVSYVP